MERARGGCGNLGKGLGGAAPDSPLPTSSRLPSAARCTYYQGSCGAWAPGPSSPPRAPPPSYSGPLGVGLRAGLWTGKGHGKPRPRRWSFIPFAKPGGQHRAHNLLCPGRLTPTGTLDWHQQRASPRSQPLCSGLPPLLPGQVQGRWAGCTLAEHASRACEAPSGLPRQLAPFPFRLC